MEWFIVLAALGAGFYFAPFSTLLVCVAAFCYAIYLWNTADG